LRQNYILQRKTRQIKQGDKKSANRKAHFSAPADIVMRNSRKSSFMSNSVMLHSSASVAELDDACWQKNVYSRFDATLRSQHLQFPCPYGVAGHQSGHIRFGFCDVASASIIAEHLNLFIPNCREFGNWQPAFPTSLHGNG